MQRERCLKRKRKHDHQAYWIGSRRLTYLTIVGTYMTKPLILLCVAFMLGISCGLMADMWPAMKYTTGFLGLSAAVLAVLGSGLGILDWLEGH